MTPAATRPPAEAVLIKRARQARKLSPEDAAPLAGVIKARRWRQIEAGARVDHDVLAHMAAAVGADPDQLEEAGRGESAAILREILRQQGEPPAARPLGMTPDEETIAKAFLTALRSARGEENRT